MLYNNEGMLDWTTQMLRWKEGKTITRIYFGFPLDPDLSAVYTTIQRYQVYIKINQS